MFCGTTLPKLGTGSVFLRLLRQHHRSSFRDKHHKNFLYCSSATNLGVMELVLLGIAGLVLLVPGYDPNVDFSCLSVARITAAAVNSP